VQDLGGFGDLIFGVRVLKTLQERWPHARFCILTNGAEKLKKIVSAVPCPVVKYDPSKALYAEAHALLRESDLVIVNPTGASTALIPQDAGHRTITVIEYNRPDYGLNARGGHFMTGIGRNTLGICLDSTMRAFAKVHFPLQHEKKMELLHQLENHALRDLINVLDPANRTYLGYGNKDMDRFLEVLVRYEARLDTHDAVILAITNTPYEDSLKKKIK
jgi:hypothetical protein